MNCLPDGSDAPGPSFAAGQLSRVHSLFPQASPRFCQLPEHRTSPIRFRLLETEAAVCADNEPEEVNRVLELS